MYISGQGLLEILVVLDLGPHDIFLVDMPATVATTSPAHGCCRRHMCYFKSSGQDPNRRGLASRGGLESGGGPAYDEVWCQNLVQLAYHFVAKFQSFVSRKEICPNEQEKKIGNNNFRI